MSPEKISFKIYQGSTFSEVFRWESSKKIYKTITGITNAAPCVITANTHEVPEGWRVKIANVAGMTDINSSDTYHVATVLTNNTIELNDVNSVGYKTYTSGGILEYNEPVSLTGYTARMQIREKLDSATVIKELTTENGGITINTSNSYIQIEISAADTALLSFSTAVYSIELVSSGGKVYQLANGTLTLVKEITR